MSFPMNSLPDAFQEDHGSTDLGDEKPLAANDDGGEDEQLDTSTAAEGVWLVKVPKFLMEKWSQVQEQGVILGRIRVYDEKDAYGNQKMAVMLNEPAPSTSDTKGKGKQGSNPLPPEYKLTMQNASTKNMFMFGEKEEDDLDSGEVGSRKRRRITSLLGTVAHECSLTPSISSASASSHYSTIMRERQRKATEPKRTVKILDVDKGTANRLASGVGLAGVKGRVSNFVKAKPSASANSELRTTRMPQNELIDLLFTHFETSRYWSIKSLKEHVKQPDAYLKETLAKIAQLVKRGPYNGMWTLLDTFRDRDGVKNEGVKGDEDEERDRRGAIPLAREVVVIPDEVEEELEFEEVA